MSAYDWFGSLALNPLGLILAGPVAAAVGVSTTLWVAAAGMLVTAALAVAQPSVRNLRALAVA